MTREGHHETESDGERNAFFGEGIFDMSERAVAAATNIAATAANVVEKELALGIKAASFIERRLLDVDDLRSDDSNGMMHRFRRSAHEALDIAVDLIAIATKPFADQPGDLVDIRTESLQGEPGANAGYVPVLDVPGPLKPGQSGEVVMSISNETGSPSGEFALESSDIVSSAGDRIANGRVYFNPPTLSVSTEANSEVVVGVEVPEDQPSGTYEGLLRAPGVEQFRALIRVRVD